VNDFVNKPSVLIRTLASHVHDIAHWLGTQLAHCASFYKLFDLLMVSICDLFSAIWTLLVSFVGLFKLNLLFMTIFDLLSAVWALFTSFTGLFDGYYEAIQTFYNNNVLLVNIGTVTILSLVVFAGIYYRYFYCNHKFEIKDMNVIMGFVSTFMLLYTIYLFYIDTFSWTTIFFDIFVLGYWCLTNEKHNDTQQRNYDTNDRSEELSRVHYDGLGRKLNTKQYNYNPNDKSEELSQTQYDGLGRNLNAEHCNYPNDKSGELSQCHYDGMERKRNTRSRIKARESRENEIYYPIFITPY
jgi:hypothetical protein